MSSNVPDHIFTIVHVSSRVAVYKECFQVTTKYITQTAFSDNGIRTTRAFTCSVSSATKPIMSDIVERHCYSRLVFQRCGRLIINATTERPRFKRKGKILVPIHRWP